MKEQLLINNYIESLVGKKKADLQALHNLIVELLPECQIRYYDGKNEQGKIIANPNIGYGNQILKYADGSTRQFYKLGISANTSGISIYVMGLKSKEYLLENYGDSIGKASITSYCIKFKSLEDINLDALKLVITQHCED